MPRLLVLAQFSCIAVLMFAGSWDMPWWAWALFAMGIAVFLWASFSLGASNFTILPVPRPGNTLSTTGAYRWMRHPMYTSVLLCGGAVSIGSPSMGRWVALATCLVVLVLKIRLEEALLGARHRDYPQRMLGVARLVPGIW
ncbi:MAG TPA: methyltransferase [Flavobacteriales bacterium]|nr:hypothetical protein [Flavobacteriales bacterium]HMW95994.1 methyltransferase [Flavobacteriales bacterium]HNE80342.1 methyltransferase [Flavobacteriales bacterium]HNI04928.1 methyltransferase [Flavobacteriales bacterium]HNK40725.1 methyltransferase [Flavobacteriales bacterium]